MGNCASTLREGLQCPHGSVFLYSLGYDDNYRRGNALALDQERPTMCIFEAPDNEALFQHAQEYYEGLPGSSLFVRNVLTVGNYDYTQVRAGVSRWLPTARRTKLVASLSSWHGYAGLRQPPSMLGHLLGGVRRAPAFCPPSPVPRPCTRPSGCRWTAPSIIQRNSQATA